jgi:hypothetical protein
MKPVLNGHNLKKSGSKVTRCMNFQRRFCPGYDNLGVVHGEPRRGRCPERRGERDRNSLAATAATLHAAKVDRRL